MADLTKKYRLIWDVSTCYIQNDYEKDWTGTMTKLVNAGDMDFIESNTYQDILDKIDEESLQIDPSLNL